MNFSVNTIYFYLCMLLVFYVIFGIVFAKRNPNNHVKRGFAASYYATIMVFIIAISGRYKVFMFTLTILTVYNVYILLKEDRYGNEDKPELEKKR